MSAEKLTSCESCGAAICLGDMYCPGLDADLCVKCAPTLQDLIDHPEDFYDATSEADGSDFPALNHETAAPVVARLLGEGVKPTDPIFLQQA